MTKFIPVAPGDRVTLRKPHPCGGRDWAVTRIGADIGLACLTCGRKMMLTRDEFERRCTSHTPAENPTEKRDEGNTDHAAT